MNEENQKPAVENSESQVAEVSTEVTTPAAAKKKKVKRSVPSGRVYIQATFNNTIISVTDAQGGVLAASSAGACGFRGSKKGTAYAAQVAAEKVYGQVKQLHGMTKVDVYVNGIGQGRDTSIRSIGAAGITVSTLSDVTGAPHGGVRPRKAKRN